MLISIQINCGEKNIQVTKTVSKFFYLEGVAKERHTSIVNLQWELYLVR